MDRYLRLASKVLLRILIEFGPPLLSALAWIRYAPPAESGPLAFSVVFFAASWFWGQFLRICYQQSQRERFADLGADLAAVKSTMETITHSIAELRNKDVPAFKPEILHLSSLAVTANSQIDSANTKYEEAARSYVLRAEPGRYRVTSGSE